MAHHSRLRKVGGSVMLAIPKPIAEALDLAADSPIAMSVRSGKLVIEPGTRKRHSLDDLLAKCRPARPTRDEREWTSGKARGRELI